MADIIKVLPESLANQIAAGEVVQRPASVVKELLENAIDGGATEIQVYIKDSGKSSIHIVDNGIGMSHLDARLCFERHATSKLKNTDDLFCIRTMGFRGEALASIAAVAQVELKTRHRDEAMGTEVRIEGSHVKLHTPCAYSGGTSIHVKNLFYNVPARRQFLKSDLVEFRHIQEEFFKIALAHPEVAFSLYNHDEEVCLLHAAKPIQRILSILGPAYKDQLAPCREETHWVSLYGYIGKPATARKTRGDQYFYVNNRFIKHPLLHHAVCEAYKGLLEPEHHPSYVIFFSIDPKHVDVNVHPTKTEVKFDDERTLYGILQSAVRKALAQFELSQSIDFDENINQSYLFPTEPSGKRNPTAPTPLNIDRQIDFMFAPNYRTSPENTSSMPGKEYIRFEKIESRMNHAPQREFDFGTEHHPGNQFILQLHQSFLLTRLGHKVILIDQQAAHERILYESFSEKLHLNIAATQQSLFPQTIKLSPADFTLLMHLKDDIERLGFSLSDFGKQEIVVQGIPAELLHLDVQQAFESFIEQFKRNETLLHLDAKENIARSLAKKTCIKRGQPLTEPEQQHLVERLFTCKNPAFNPDGQATLIHLDKEKLHSLFIS